jgi:rhomboid family GlyGly-CTERM serine protease
VNVMTNRFFNSRITAENSAKWSKGVPWLTLATASLALCLFFLAGPAAPELVYDRAAVEAGQWWRLLTGHLIHSDPSHLGWDLAGLLVLGWLFEGRFSGLRFSALLLIGIMAVDVWLWWGPAPLRYCGMSGFLNSLLAGGLIQQWRKTRDWLLPLVGLGAICKILLETLHGQALFTATAWPSVPLAHAAGFAGGILAALIFGEKMKTPSNWGNQKPQPEKSKFIHHRGHRERQTNIYQP